MIDAAVRLADGRELTYTVCGASAGPVVMYFHGAPTSRFDLVGMRDAFEAAGVTVVSVDRPGYGGSTPQPGRSLADWPADAAALADHLEVSRFTVMGLSSGGPYAVATAAGLGDRVASAGVVAGVTDMGWDDAWVGYDESETAVMRMGGDENAATEWYANRYGADGSGFFEETRQLAPADEELFADEEAAAGFFATVSEAFRQGVGGYAQDIVVQGAPWSFDASSIRSPVRVLHGEADTVVPVAHGRHTARLIGTATLRTFPDHGHLSIMSEIPALAAELATELR